MVANLPFLLQYLPRQSLRAQDKYHRRCSSFPDAAMQRTPSTSLWSSKSTVGQSRGQELKELNERCLQSEPSVPVVESEIAEEVTADDDFEVATSESQELQPKRFFLVKPWRSLPDLSGTGHVAQSLVKPFRGNKTEPSTPCKEVKKTFSTFSALSVNYSSISIEKERTKRKVKKGKRAAGSTSSAKCSPRRERGDHPKQLQPSYAHRQEEEILHGGRRQFDQADVDRSLPAEADHRAKPDGISQLQSPPGNFRLHCRAGPGKRPFLRLRSHHRRHRAGEISSVAFFARRPFGNSDFPGVPGQM
ncbi:unnamed protein product [Nesidiocoris tenuis]|uniref:Uncharacterized protein n=1 Tax=Nesidiocoris tenuis TaxID=355587 RepID=A0A6H5GG23_9HEMI|nr:unnamed protein product [Nesidiocoris tenuis]